MAWTTPIDAVPSEDPAEEYAGDTADEVVGEDDTDAGEAEFPPEVPD